MPSALLSPLVSWSHPGTVPSLDEPQYSPSLGGAFEFQYELPVFEMG
jgi:hypothetical protein